MSIKKFFDQADNSRNYLTEQEKKSAFKEIESSKNLKQQRIKQDLLLPQVEYLDPANFAKFGSAYMYYKGAVERIIDYYPYDGSDAEITAFYNKSMPIEKYIFNKMYPRTNGYVTLCANGWGVSESIIDGYGAPATPEYITFFGGPNISTSLTTLKDMEPNELSSKFQYNNIYDTDIYQTEGYKSDYGKGTRESNLKSNFDNGVTVEFWIKTGSISHSSLTSKQVVFDMWNNEPISSDAYGRITIELTGGAGSGNPVLITAQSGAASSSAQFCFTSSIGQNLSASSLSNWGHYAVTMYNSGTNFVADLYINGHLNDTNTYTGRALNELNSKNMVARLGALVASPSGSSAAAGSGKLSGSIDEFRFWKVARNGAEIGKNWFDQIRGGVNSDIANAELGMYYKFNEGITGQTALDSVILDYGGRLCNGVWTGYTVNSRNTGSAMMSASVALREYEDPIIYAVHPDIVSLKSGLLATGSYHDQQNAGLVRNLLPSWLTDDTTTTDQTDLDKLCHILGAYFDKLHLLTGQLSSLKHVSYTSASAEPLPFAQHLPQHLGLYAPEIFVDSTIIEKFKNRTDNEHFEGDLSEAKNLIYSNLYNNLASIYKAKGTEKAIRNTLRCFNLDDTLIKYNVYSNNQQYELKNNLKQTLKRKTFANFNTAQGSTAVIYQAEDPHTSSRGFISGTNTTGYEDRHGLTVETSVVFPRFFRSIDKFDRSFKNISLFGMQTVNSASTSDPAFLTGSQDAANFQVYAIRDAVYSKNAYFMLTSSTEPYNFPTLTSSLFFDVYDDSNWNLSVRVKPSNYPIVDLVSGSTGYKYDVIFRGTNNNLGTILNSFEVTSSITKTVGQEILQVPKRIYIGARNTNITGSNVYKTDVTFSSAKYWTKFVDNTTIDQHLYDAENYGISGSYRYVSELDENTKETLNFNALALNWYFGNVTSSDAAGNFYVTDLSSGSVDNRNKFGWMGNISSYLHSGHGYRFDTSNTNIVENKNVNEFKFIDPEQAVSSDMVQILDADDVSFGITEQVPNYIYTIEKSLYAAVTEEILDFFAGVIDFHHLIGQPVNRYRDRYKAMEHLRRMFFEKVQDTSTVEKFTEYYKWFDDAISIILSQLVPASADFVSDSFNTIESHVLERNKYKSQFPTIEFRKPDPEPVILGIGEKIISFEDISSPLPTSPRRTDIKQTYWRQRASSSAAEITSNNAIIDSQRQTFKEVIWSTPYFSGAAPTFSNLAGTKYHRSQRLASQRYATYILENKLMKDYVGGVNFEGAKNIGYTYNNLYPAGPVMNPAGGVYVPQNVLLAEIKDLVAIQELEIADRVTRKPNEKVKRVIKVQSGRNFEQGIGYTALKSTVAFPFNIMSSSVRSGYNKQVIDRVTASIEITNLHNDVYGRDMERPMQTTWSEYAAGGHQSRHVGLNISASGRDPNFSGLDNYTTRPEAWKLLLGKCGEGPGDIGMVGADYPWPEANEEGETPYPMTASQKAVYYRDFVAKTPYVLKNIRMRTGSTILGNYRNNYEVVQAAGAWSNPRQFIEIGGQPNLPTGAFPNTAKFATQIRTFLDIHRGHRTGSAESTLGTGSHFQFVQDYNAGYLSGTENKTVIVSRFSNPGGLEVSPPGYGDVRSNEFSVYNATQYRNMTVLKPSQGPAGTISEITGVGGPGIRVGDIHALDYGLRSHLARHTARFGRDSLILPPDDQRAAYSLAKPFIGYSDTKFYRSHETLQGWWRLNQDISSPSSGDAIDSSGNGRDGTFAADANRPAFSTTLGPSKYIQSGSCTFDATDDSTNILTAAVWDDIIGNDTAAGSTEKMTFSAWIYKTGDGENNYGRILDFGDSDLYVFTDTDDKIYIGAKWNGNNAVQWRTTETISLNTWAHVAITYDATSSSNDPKIYINGIAATVSHFSGTKTGAYYGIVGQDAHIGNRNAGDRTFQGQLSDVAVWNSILTSDEVVAIHNASKLPEKVGPGYIDTQRPGFHKVHRNGLMRMKKTSATTYETSSIYDNFNVQHMIPRSDKQYAFYADTIHNPDNQFRYTGYMPTSGRMQGMYSSSYTNGVQPFFNFVSASDFGSFEQAGQRGWGNSRAGMSAPQVVSFLPTAFNNLNLNIYEPLTGTTNTLGYPSWVPLFESVEANTQYRNTSMVPEHESISAQPALTASFFNALMLKRNGIYGWTPFAQTHQSDHPVLLNQRRNNVMMMEYHTPGVLQEFPVRPVSLKGRPVRLNYDYQTVQILRNEKIVTEQNATLKTSYNNEFIYFNSRSLDNHLDIPEILKSEITPFEQLLALKEQEGFKLNWVHYTENVFPSLKNEFSPTSSFRYGYDNLMWRRGLDSRIDLGSKTILSNSYGIGHRMSASSWPLDAPKAFLIRDHAPCILTYTNSIGSPVFDLSSLRSGGSINIASNSAGTMQQLSNAAVASSGTAGELQNTYGWYHQTSSNRAANTVWAGHTYYPRNLKAALSPAGLYARKHTLASPLSINPPNYPNPSASVRDFGVTGGIQPWITQDGTGTTTYEWHTASIGSGEAFWDAPTTAGYLTGTIVYRNNIPEKVLTFVSAASQPWYHDYDEYKENLRLVARGYSVVPEFRISDRLENYLKGDIDDFADFTIPGTSFNSTQPDFYKDFSNSDFMQKFLNIKDISNLNAKEFKLTCNAVVKFNPYKGFYPADRTLQLVSQFSRSYASTFSLTSEPSTGVYASGNMSFDGAPYRMALQPLFAPGILYNSIKSGIACDWPLVTDGNRINASAFTSSAMVGVADEWRNGINYAWYPNAWHTADWWNSGSFWDLRLPFEAIINPSKAMAGVSLIDMEPHPLVNIGQYIDTTASMATAPSDNLYTLMASNFVAEVGDFFLPKGQYSSLKSEGVKTTADPMTFPTGAVYGSRLRMRASYSGSRTYEHESSSYGDNTWFTKLGAGGTYINATSRTQRFNGVTTGSFEIPQDPGKNPDFERDFIMYSRVSAFGPPFISWPDNKSIYANWYLYSLGGYANAGTGSPTPVGFDPWLEQQNREFSMAASSGAMDCINGYNWAYTPPYYHGEAWCDFVFRPTYGETYTLEKILTETDTIFYRCDPGPQTSSYEENTGIAITNPKGTTYSSLINDNTRLSMSGPSNHGGLAVSANSSPYASTNINKNAMHLSASLNLFGIENVYKKRYDRFGREIFTERELVGKRWVIQPKFETPMLNFARKSERPNVGAGTGSEGRTKTIPTVANGTILGYGADTAADGMWHQFGTRPGDSSKGIFLEMTDIPDSWLQYHYSVVSESSVYNNYDPASVGPVGVSKLHQQMESFGDLMGFKENNSSVRLGELAEQRTIKEAVVAIPYIQEPSLIVTPAPDPLPDPSAPATPTGATWKRFINIPRARIEAARHFEEGTEAGDSLDAAGTSIRRMVDKMSDYVLPPKFDFLRNPLADPIVMYIFEFKYKLDKDDLSYIWQNLAPRKHKKTHFQQDAVAHELFNTELLEESNLMDNPNLRWMIFKVKQKSQKTYRDKVLEDYGTITMDPIIDEASISDYPLLYNWPYDYLSIVELVKMEAEVLYKDDSEEIDEDETP